MTTHTVTVRATPAQLARTLRNLPQSSRGTSAAAKVLLVRCGLALLGKIKEAFLAKARGGTDEAGERWKPLSPFTIAYSRRHPGLARKGKGKRTRLHHPSAILSQKQRQRWWEVYGRMKARFSERGEAGAKAHAARYAWKVLKDEGAPTIIGRYGATPVEILRDTGLLFNSLSPAIPPAAASSAPPRTKEQVFLLKRAEVMIGTKRKWAWVHHHGSARVPQRRLWPRVEDWPASWWAALAEQAQYGVIDVLLYELGRLS
jgi:hypothetical protein